MIYDNFKVQFQSAIFALKALEEIDSKKYEQGLVESGITNIYRYAIAISSKECSVK